MKPTKRKKPLHITSEDDFANPIQEFDLSLLPKTPIKWESPQQGMTVSFPKGKGVTIVWNNRNDISVKLKGKQIARIKSGSVNSSNASL